MSRIFKRRTSRFRPMDDLADDRDGSLIGSARMLSVAHFRLVLVMSGLAFLFTLVAVSLVRNTLFQPVPDFSPVFTFSDSVTLPLMRSDILDRNGHLIATNLPTVHLYAHPQQIKDKAETAVRLSQALPDLTYADVFDQLSKDVSFVYIKRHLTPAEQYAANKLGIPGLNFENTQRRIYPFGPLFSHLIGFVNMEHHGVMGVEAAYDSFLREHKTTLKLTVDVGVQEVFREQLLSAMDTFEAKGAIGMIMDVHRFELIAMVSLPDFDPNLSQAADAEALFNQATLGVYELGSVFKVFNTALALDSGKVKMTDSFDARKPLKIGRHTVTDFSPQNKVLTVAETMTYSSNIASALMALRVGRDTQREYLKMFGFFDAVPFSLRERALPLFPSSWGEPTVATVAYGYGVAVSPLHVLRAAAAMVNGGVIKPVTVVVSDTLKPEAHVITPETSKNIRHLMGQVVEEGSAKKASLKDYRLGGKTGTAQKLVNGRYVNRKVRTTFIGAFPIEAPQYVIVVILDEPKLKAGDPFNTAGWNAAPTAGKIIDLVAPMLGVVGRDAE